MGRIVFSLAKWAVDGEAMPLRLAAVREGDSKLYMSLCQQRDDRVKGRRIALLVGLVVLVAAAVVLRFAPWWAQTLAVLAVLGTAARAGRSPERATHGHRGPLPEGAEAVRGRRAARAFIAAGQPGGPSTETERPVPPPVRRIAEPQLRACGCRCSGETLQCLPRKGVAGHGGAGAQEAWKQSITLRLHSPAHSFRLVHEPLAQRSSPK